MTDIQEYFNNPRWLKEIQEAFVTLDRNHDGRVSRNDYMLMYDMIQGAFPDRRYQLITLQSTILEYCDAFGLREGVSLGLQEFLPMAASMCLHEATSYHAGRTTQIERLVYAIFDVIGRSDSNIVTFDEYRTLMVAIGFGADAAEGAFHLLDRDRNGYVSREEFADADIRFWCTLNDGSTFGLFGPKFELHH